MQSEMVDFYDGELNETYSSALILAITFAYMCQYEISHKMGNG